MKPPKSLISVVVSLLSVCVCVWTPATASAQDIPCSWEWKPMNEAWQHGSGLWLKYDVQTWLVGIPCQIGAYAEGSVDGVEDSGVRTSGVISASAQKQVPVPSAGLWNVSGRHSRGTLFGELFLGNTNKLVQINNPQSAANLPCDTDPAWPGCPNQWTQAHTPLLIDTKGNGFQLSSAAHGVLFDIDGDGQPEQIGWTRKGADDSWLALDRNGNGVIDNGTELFGNHTPVRGTITASNGFDAANYLQSESAVTASLDSMLTRHDAAWQRLLLWRDRNHNGVSEPEELKAVSSSPLASIDLRYREVSKVRKGNEIRLVSRAVWGGATRRIVDVWLDVVK